MVQIPGASSILGGLVILRGTRRFLGVSVFVILAGGLALWTFGRPAYHVGASGLIFGYFGYLAARGWYSRSAVELLIALVTVFLYGGMLWGVLPATPRVSWESHLFGLIAGAAAARAEGKR